MGIIGIARYAADRGMDRGDGGAGKRCRVACQADSQFPGSTLPRGGAAPWPYDFSLIRLLRRLPRFRHRLLDRRLVATVITTVVTEPTLILAAAGT